jgi:hypothetical protein
MALAVGFGLWWYAYTNLVVCLHCLGRLRILVWWYAYGNLGCKHMRLVVIIC